MPAGRALHSRGLGALIGLMAILTGAGAIGNSTPASPLTAAAAPTPSTPGAGTDIAAEAPSDAAPTQTQSSLHPMVRPAEAPLITGTPRYGVELTFEKPTWRPGKVALGYQWLRDGVPIPEATGRRYVAAAADIGHDLSVRITGTRSGFETAVQETAAVGPVVGRKLIPATPQVSGWPRVGSVLTGSARSWGPGTVQLDWQWYRDDVKIAGATGGTYLLDAADAGHTIRLRVRGSAAGYQPAIRFSAPTTKVAPGVLNPAPVPVYSGVAQVGQTLTALPKSWGPGDVSLTFQWYRSGEDGDVRIKGATRAKYVLVDADAGHRLKVLVTGRKPGYTTVQRHSAWTSVVATSAASTNTAAGHR